MGVRRVGLNEKRKITFGCFHGTSEKKALSIMMDQQFRVRNRSNHWLGNGVYFFVDDEKQAEWWARNQCWNAYDSPVVLYFPLTLSRDELLNLNALADLNTLDLFARSLNQVIDFESLDVRQFDDYRYRCALLDLFFEKNPRYKAVRRTFLSTKTRVGSSGFSQLSDQLCIFDQSLIPFSRIGILES